MIRILFASAIPGLKSGVDGVRRLVQAGVRRAVVRLYDAIDSLILRLGSVAAESSGPPSLLSRLGAAARAIVGGGKRHATGELLEHPELPNTALDRLPDAALGGCVLVLVFEGREGLARVEERLAVDLLADLGTDLGEALARRWFEQRYAISDLGTSCRPPSAVTHGSPCGKGARSRRKV
jgi:hypothetical protein